MKLFWSTAAALSIVVAGLVSMAQEAPVASHVSQGSETNPEIGFIQSRLLVPGEPGTQFPNGSRMVRMRLGVASRSPVIMTPQFFAVARPRISSDGTKVVFSGKMERNSIWQIWEMAVDGSHQRQVTHCSGDCLLPDYLPRNQIVYTAISGNGVQRSSALYVCQGNGDGAHPITFGPGDFQVEAVLSSGRILVSARYPLLAGNTGSGHRRLYTIRPDGTGLRLFRQDLSAGSVHSGAEELADRTVLFVEGRDTVAEQVGGDLAWILPGGLHAEVIGAAPSVFESAHELQAGSLIVAKQSSGGSVTTRTFDLYSFDLRSKTLGNRLYHQPEMSSISPVPFAPHPEPLSYPSILHLEQKSGRILCLNSYVSGDEEHGHTAIPIAQVRVIALEQSLHERVLGNAPVEKDGSFYMTVPSDMPIRFELLNSKGVVMRVQKSWIWARPGEDRGCLGCHENPALAPENRWPLTLNRFDTPTPVGVSVHP